MRPLQLLLLPGSFFCFCILRNRLPEHDVQHLTIISKAGAGIGTDASLILLPDGKALAVNHVVAHVHAVCLPHAHVFLQGPVRRDEDS